jgi:hypothetical protein
VSTPEEELTAQTLAYIRKAAATAGVFASTGIAGVDLSGLVSLVPVNVPARNNTSAFPRVIAGEGSQTALWRALLNINSGQSDAAIGMDYAGSMTNFQEQDVYAPYKPLAKAGRVTLDAVAVARNYADALSIAELQTLNQLFIFQDMHIINSQAWSLGTVSAPTLAASSTGGSLPQSQAVYVKVAARSGANYFVGGSTAASAAANLTTSSVVAATYAVTASLAAVKGAVAYDWYVGSSAGTQYYAGTTTVASFTVTSIPTANQALSNLPLLSSTAPTAVPTADTSYNANNWYNGVIASTLGDYGSTGPVTPGSGTASGATFIDNGGNAPALSGGGIDILDKINDALWASVQLSPTAYMINSLQGDEISKAILASSSATTFLPPTDADARTNLAGGGYIGRYINRAAGGVPVSLEIHPRVAPGTIIARTDRVPFPGSNIGTAFEVRCQYDTMRFDYAANYNPGVLGGGPRYDFEIRSMETLVNRAPVAQAIVSNVG